ncbi:MAG: type II toxin-antitoxin system prevent-host-death family antitoxin [Polyangiaceae bacterium]|nr:type II toxin-antitoxin system prevent-host-death family antitoxin [Polyangiaceae bacterium]
MKRTNVAELKAHLSEHLRAVEAGSTVEILVNKRPVARLVPIEEEEVELIPPERPFSEVCGLKLPPLNLPVSSLELLRRERGDR